MTPAAKNHDKWWTQAAAIVVFGLLFVVAVLAVGVTP